MVVAGQFLTSSGVICNSIDALVFYLTHRHAFLSLGSLSLHFLALLACPHPSSHKCPKFWHRQVGVFLNSRASWPAQLQATLLLWALHGKHS